MQARTSSRNGTVEDVGQKRTVRVSNVVSFARLTREWIQAGGPLRHSKEGRGRYAGAWEEHGTVGCPREKVSLVTLWRAKKLTKLWVGQLPSTSSERRCSKDKCMRKVDHCAVVNSTFVKMRWVIGELRRVVIVKGMTIGE